LNQRSAEPASQDLGLDPSSSYSQAVLTTRAGGKVSVRFDVRKGSHDAEIVNDLQRETRRIGAFID